MKNRLCQLLALLRAAQILHHTAHWIVKGASFVGDHELFEEFYTALTDEYDSLAESLVHEYGETAVDPVEQTKLIHEFVEHFCKESDLYTRSVKIEMAIESGLSMCVQGKEGEKLSVGLDNFLRQIADNHRRPAYKIGRRTKR